MPQPRGFPFRSSVVNPNDREPYAEYKVTTEGNKTECYIESVEGQPFSVLVALDEDKAPSNTFSISCTVDGESIKEGLIGRFPDHYYRDWQLKGKIVAEGRLARFEFGATQFTGKSHTHRQ
jgi:hypothetical protein